MVSFTTEKVVIVLGVTAVVIVLAYVLRFGQFRRLKPKGTSDKSQQNPSDTK